MNCNRRRNRKSSGSLSGLGLSGSVFSSCHSDARVAVVLCWSHGSVNSCLVLTSRFRDTGQQISPKNGRISHECTCGKHIWATFIFGLLFCCSYCSHLTFHLIYRTPERKHSEFLIFGWDIKIMFAHNAKHTVFFLKRSSVRQKQIQAFLRETLKEKH